MRLLKRPLLLVLALPVVAAAQSGSGPAYPVKPVRVLIPWQASGSNDIAGRVVFQKVAESLGQQFFIDNRPGASGTIGSDIVAKSPPDGYTIMVHSTTHIGNAHFFKNLPYDTMRDFVGVALLAAQPGMLVVHPSLPVKSVKEFIALAKARPAQLLYASSGNGSSPHLSMALLMHMAGLKLTHVPYKGGPSAVISIVAGETQIMLPTVATIVTQVQAGKLRPLGVSSATRLKQYPDLPTIAEAGVPGYEMNPWVGVFAPAATPKAIVQLLNAECRKALDKPEVAANLMTQGLIAWPMTVGEFAKRIRADYEKYALLIKLTGATVD